MRIAILGGTGFLSRHVAARVLADGHALTLYHRNPSDLFPEAEHVLGDRDGSLNARDFDVVIDCCGYVPRVVEESRRKLGGHYVFVSSISVYDDLSTGPDEDGAVKVLDEPTEEMTPESYGANKALCEAFADLSVRAGLIGGPHDPTDRLTWWALPRQVVPKDAVTQCIDVRDLADWIVDNLDATGVFNVTAPPVPLRVLQPDALEIPWDVIEAADVTPWVDLPAWSPKLGVFACDRARARGLRCRPLTETAADALATRPEREWEVGLSDEQRAALLASLS